jgi:acyl carrier protein
MSDTAERIRKILAAKFGVDQATLLPDVSFVTDLNADSLDIVELARWID